MSIPKAFIAPAALSFMIAVVAPAQAETTEVTYSIENLTGNTLKLYSATWNADSSDPQANNLEIPAGQSRNQTDRYETNYDHLFGRSPKSLTNWIVYGDGAKKCIFATTLMIERTSYSIVTTMKPKRDASATSSGSIPANCQVLELTGSDKPPFDYSVKFSMQ